MPDQDIFNSGRARGWGAACTLLANVGVTPETIVATERALASELRRVGLHPGLAREAFQEEVLRIFEGKLVAPARIRCAEAVGLDVLRNRENSIREASSPLVDHFYKQLSLGKRPAPPRRRLLSAKSTAEILVRSLAGPPR